MRADEAAVIQLPGAQQPPRPSPASPVRRRAGRMLAAALGGLAVAAATVLAVTGTISVKRSEAGAAVPAPPSLPAPPRPGPVVEVSSLTGPRDAPPVLVAGEPPRSPAPDQGLRPTVILRLLVDESGRVARAEVYQPRHDLGDFEQAALEAVRHFTFRPARRDGEPVPAWVNWPVDFI